MKETNLSLFENFEPKNNDLLSKKLKQKKRKRYTLFTILNGEKADLTIEEIFDSKKYNSIKAVTFSLDSSFTNKYFSGFENVNLIIGIPDADVQMRGLEAFRNIIDANKKMLKREQITFFESLSRENQENVLERKWEIKVPLKSSIHCKFYLLESETEKRLIIGSANLSNQAFSEKSSQYENIVIFDNDDLMFENYNEYFEFLKEKCMDFIPNLFLKKAKKIKILNKKNATDEELEKAVPINFTFSEREGLMTEIAKDFFEKFSNNFLELDKEEAEKEGGIIEQMKSIKSHYDTREKEIEKEKQFEKGSYEIVNDYISSRKVSKQDNVLTKPLKFAERIKEKIKLKTAPKIKEHVSDREKMILRENDMSDTDSGLYLIEKVTKTDENGKEIETQETRRFGKRATNEEIKNSIENIFQLIESYEKYVPRYDADYGSRIIEAILYSFSAPFLQELRKRITKESTSKKELNIPMFMFLGGDSHSGKTTLTKLIRKMMGIYDIIDPPVYSGIIGKTSPQWRADTIKQINVWLREDNVVPMFVDELDDNFFTQRTEELIKDLANETATSERNTCCFIGNTNTKNFRMPNQAERRSYYIPIDRPINKSAEADASYNRIASETDSILFDDFVMRMSKIISNDDVNFDKYNNCLDGKKLDFLFPAREIFKEYFEIAGKEIPEWFPLERRDDTALRNMEKWQTRYDANPELFVIKENNGKKVYFFDLNLLNKMTGQNNLGEEYLDALNPEVKLYQSNEIVKLDIKKFHKWIKRDIPEAVLEAIGELPEKEKVEEKTESKKEKRGFFDFLKRNKKHKQD